MASKIRFWVDPACPWCWVTSRWVVDIAGDRDLDVSWEPISLLFKNDTQPDSPWYEPVAWTRDLLRVMEAVRAKEGSAPLGALYTEYGRRIHHDGQRLWDAALALEAVGLDTAYAAAATDESWDEVIRARMNEGLAMVGNDVGTPIISFVRGDGKEVGIFGPVITRVPPRSEGLAAWDAVTTLTTLDGFWELKRTRTESPDFGPRP